MGMITAGAAAVAVGVAAGAAGVQGVQWALLPVLNVQLVIGKLHRCCCLTCCK
jgi:hypothetical protein